MGCDGGGEVGCVPPGPSDSPRTAARAVGAEGLREDRAPWSQLPSHKPQAPFAKSLARAPPRAARNATGLPAARAHGTPPQPEEPSPARHAQSARAWSQSHARHGSHRTHGIFQDQDEVATLDLAPSAPAHLAQDVLDQAIDQRELRRSGRGSLGLPGRTDIPAAGAAATESRTMVTPSALALLRS